MGRGDRPRRAAPPAGAAASVRRARRRRVGLLLAVLLAAAFFAAGLLAGCSASPSFRGAVLDEPRPAVLRGVNWDGRAFELAALDEEVAVVFFGYTFCPDICPITLAKMKRLVAELGPERAGEVAVVFVSVDPARDSRQKLAEYVPGFDRRFYGVRAEGRALAAAQESFSVTARTRASGGQPRADGFYFVDHTSSIFLLDATRRPRVSHPMSAPVADLAADVETLLAEPAA